MERGHSPSPLGSPRVGLQGAGAAGRRHSSASSPMSASPGASPSVGGRAVGRMVSTPGAEGENSPGRVGVLTSQDAVDEALAKMQDKFSATLQTLSGRSRKTRDTDRYREGDEEARYPDFESPRRTERISEVTEESSGPGSEGGSAPASFRSQSDSLRGQPRSRGGSIGLRGGGSTEGSGRIEALGLVLRTTRPGSRPDSVASEEVIGRLELPEDDKGKGKERAR